jgi:lipopolysaccharide export LptBFGC system permease protein LptF
MSELIKSKINGYRKLEEKIIKKHNEKIQKIEKIINILENKSQIKEDDNFETIVFKKYLELESVRAVANYINELGYRVKTNSYIGERKYIGTDITKIILSDLDIDKDLKEVVKLIQELNYEHMSKKWG